ncbi:MAG: T9SS type A sorting domain-containing protein [Bacteroidota bacterium]|nr:T9SS type A sorting domain-containing protein [Bacteroidota bacterium]
MPSARLTLSGGVTNIRLELLVQDECDPSRYLNCTYDFVPNYAVLCRIPDAPRPALYPNPSSGDVAIATAEGKTVSYEWVKVRDVQGRTVLEIVRPAGRELTTFNIKALPPGIYEVQLYDGKSVMTSRISRE